MTETRVLPATFVRGEFPRTTNNPILNFIRRMTFLDIEKGPWVAGGAVLRVFTQRWGGDIDVFFQPDVAIDKHPGFDLLCAFPDFRRHKVDNRKQAPVHVLTFGENTNNAPRSEVQLVDHRRFQTVEDLLMDFDFTCVMAATDGWRWIAHSRFHEDVEARRLVINNTQRRIKQVARIGKYSLRGLTPEPGILRSIFALDDIEQFEQTVKSDLILEPKAYY